MATEAVLQHISRDAAADLSAKQFCAISIDTSGKAALATAAKNCDGILQNKPTSGQSSDIAIFGISKVLVSATVTAGQLLEVDATGNGSLKPVASGTVVAKALEGSGTISSGTAIITALLLKSNAVYS